LDAIIDLEHGLARLSGMVPWSTFVKAPGKLTGRGRRGEGKQL